MTRAGYLKWRADLKKFHAQKSGEILREAGYDDAMVCRVQELNLKVKERFDAEKIEFAFPTQTVYVKQG